MNSFQYSVVIPAYNEEKFLPETLSHLKNAMSSVACTGEVIVVDNNSSDRTSEISNVFGARVEFESYNQIARARNTGGISAKGEYIIFLDADTHVSGELLTETLGLLKSGKCCGGGALLSPDSNCNKGAKNIYNLVNWFCWNLNFSPGCFMFCTRKAFDAVGGFNERFYASEEVWFSNALRRWGKKSGLKFKIINNPKIKSSSRKMDTPLRTLLAFISLTLLPFSAYFRSLCWYWYKRPQ